jgi:hypothetical protein
MWYCPLAELKNLQAMSQLPLATVLQKAEKSSLPQEVRMLTAGLWIFTPAVLSLAIQVVCLSRPVRLQAVRLEIFRFAQAPPHLEQDQLQ